MGKQIKKQEVSHDVSKYCQIYNTRHRHRDNASKQQELVTRSRKLPAETVMKPSSPCRAAVCPPLHWHVYIFLKGPKTGLFWRCWDVRPDTAFMFPADTCGGGEHPTPDGPSAGNTSERRRNKNEKESSPL